MSSLEVRTSGKLSECSRVREMRQHRPLLSWMLKRVGGGKDSPDASLQPVGPSGAQPHHRLARPSCGRGMHSLSAV